MATALTFTAQARDAMAQIPPGTIAPKEGPEGQDQGLGPNNEDLEKKYPEAVAALRDLVLFYRQEGIVGRRHEIRARKKAHLFWQMQQYSSGWDADNQDWQMPLGANLGLRTSENEDAESGPRYQYVTPIYVAYGDSFIAVFSQAIPTIQWYPQKPENEQDIATAKAASEIEELVKEQNHVYELVERVGQLLWTDGKVGAFVRYVTDGQRYGFHDNPIVQAQPQKFGEDKFQCPNCSTDSAVGQMYGMACPQCGTPLTQDNFQEAPLIPVPVVTGYEKVPNGQVSISIVGSLELNTPVWANYEYEMPYLQWQLEVHEAKLRATYPKVATKIMAGNPNDADDVYARASRIAIKQGLPTTHPGDALTSLITYTRNWIEPWAFASDRVKESVRQQLLQLFPSGCYCAFAGETYCESRDERKSDHWRILHAMEGDGQNRLALGDVIIPVQERYNNWSNIITENIEYGIPPTYADPNVIDFDALSSRTAEPASMFPAKPRPGQTLAQSFYQPEAAKIVPETMPAMQELAGPMSQFLTGIFPAVFGGEMAGAGGETAAGYTLARDQAMGRLGRTWRRFKSFWAEVMTLAVECFKGNATEDTQRSVMGEDGELEQKVISIADLRGQTHARAEADESFPVLKSQQRGILQNLMNMAGDAPELAAAFAEPANMRYVKSVMGLTDFVIPGEDSANKQLREIQQLMQGQPIPTMQPGPDGTPMPGFASTVPVDQLLDRHDIEFEECKRWANSPAGITAKMKNPAGFANVRAHAIEHQKFAQEPAQHKPPSASLNLKDLPPGGKVQLAEQQGIHLDPAELIAKEAQDRQDKQDKMTALRKEKVA